MAEKTAAEIAEEQRKNINVQTTNEALEATSEETTDENTNAEVVETQTETQETTETKEQVEEIKENIEASKDKEEELKDEKKEAKTQEEKDKIQKRIDREVSKRKALETENAELKRQLAEKDKGEGKFTEEEVNQLAEKKAAEKTAEKEFVAACNRLADAGSKLDKTFNDKIQDMADDIGPIPGQMIGILDDLENGAAVLKSLTEDHELALKIYAFSPAKMGVELAKLSTKVGKPEKKPISKVPDPPNNLGGNSNKSNVVLNDKMTTKEWIAARNKQLAEKGKRF